jgi:O-antigen/teichoic acid export membrane protein
LFRKGTQLLSVVLFPIAITIALFSKHILILWLGDYEVSNSSYLLLTLLVIGTAINALVALPYSLQLAFGYTKLVFHANIVAVMVLVPLMVLMTTVFQGLGATSTWIVLNLGYLVILLPLMYRQWGLLNLGSWYKTDILLQGLVTFLIVLTIRILMPEGASNGFVLLSLFAALTLSVGGAVLVSNQLNKNILKNWKAMSDE